MELSASVETKVMEGTKDTIPVVSETYGGMSGSSGPVTFSDLGININPTTRRTVFGKIQTCHSLKKMEIGFLFLAVISFLASMGLTIQRLITLDTKSDDYTLAIILCVATVFCLYYALGGIFLERPFELLVCIVSTLIVALYAVLNFASSAEFDVIKLVRMIVAIIFGSALIGIGGKIGYEFYTSRDLIFRTVGANPKLQRACNILFMTSSLLGFDLQLGISMLIFVMTSGTSLGMIETIILGIGVPFSILWLIIGYLSLRFESKVVAILFILTSWAEPAYVIYKFCVVHHEDKVLIYCTIACGVMSLIVRALLIFCTILAILNFGVGLKDKVYGKRTPRSGSVASE